MLGIFLYLFLRVEAVPFPEPGAHVFMARLEVSNPPVSTPSQNWSYRYVQDA